MGFIASIFEFIADTIQKILKGIGDIIKWIGTHVLPIVAGIVAAGVVALSVIAFFGPTAIASVIAGIKTVVSTVGIVITKIVHAVGAAVKFTITTLKTTFGKFLEAIHFKELLAIHEIAYILSSDYRQMIDKVFSEIAKFSEEVFGTSWALTMILQNSRQLIYSVTTTLGFPVDIAEVEFIQYLDTTLQKVTDKAGTYRSNPEQIFYDVTEWIYRPVQEKYSEGNKGIILALEGVIEGVDKVAQNVFEINEQTQAVVAYLPEPLRGTLQETLEPIDERISSFRYDIYEPKMKQFEEALTTQQIRNAEIKTSMSALTQRLVDPTKYFKEIDLKPPSVRIPEKQDLRITLNEDVLQDDEQDTRTLDKAIVEREEIKTLEEIALPVAPPAPEILKLEPKEPEKKTFTPGWFVGDY
jgi:hypothetical protein